MKKFLLTLLVLSATSSFAGEVFIKSTPSEVHKSIAQTIVSVGDRGEVAIDHENAMGFSCSFRGLLLLNTDQVYAPIPEEEKFGPDCKVQLHQNGDSLSLSSQNCSSFCGAGAELEIDNLKLAK